MASKKRASDDDGDTDLVPAPKKQRRGVVDREQTQCEKWKIARSKEQIADARASVRLLIESHVAPSSFDAFLEKADERDWKQLMTRVMVAYDTTKLLGEGQLAKLLAQQGVGIHVQMVKDVRIGAAGAAGRVYSLYVDVQGMQHTKGRNMNGIECRDTAELFQVSTEYQIARLIAYTVCMIGCSPKDGEAECREFASSLFGHKFLSLDARQPRLAVLPEAILWMVSTLIPHQDAIKLGQTNKQFRDDLSKPFFGVRGDRLRQTHQGAESCSWLGEARGFGRQLYRVSRSNSNGLGSPTSRNTSAQVELAPRNHRHEQHAPSFFFDAPDV